MTQVKRARADHWEAVKETRLRALRDAPYAFASTYAREDALTDGEWQRRTAQGTWFLAWSEGGPIGIAAMVSQDHAPHERRLVAMWVEPDQRGSGVARDLVEAVCDQARAEGADAASLWVADGNPRARRFYDRCGFRPCDVRQPLPSAPEVWEERMRRPLTGTTQSSGPPVTGKAQRRGHGRPR